MLTFYPAIIEKTVYLVSVSSFEKGHKIYIIGTTLGVLSVWVMGDPTIIPQISFSYTDTFSIDHAFINAINTFIAEHFQELIAED